MNPNNWIPLICNTLVITHLHVRLHREEHSRSAPWLLPSKSICSSLHRPRRVSNSSSPSSSANLQSFTSVLRFDLHEESDTSISPHLRFHARTGAAPTIILQSRYEFLVTAEASLVMSISSHSRSISCYLLISEADFRSASLISPAPVHRTQGATASLISDFWFLVRLKRYLTMIADIMECLFHLVWDADVCSSKI